MRWLFAVLARVAGAGGPGLGAEPLRPGDHGQRGRDHPLRHRPAHQAPRGARRQRRPAQARRAAADRGPGQGPGRGGAWRSSCPKARSRPGIEEFATGRGLTMDDVQLALDARGIDQQTLDDFVEFGPALARRDRDALPRPRDAHRGRPRRRARDRRQHPAGDADAGRDRAPLRRARPARDRRARRADLPPGRRRRRASPRLAREYSRSATAERGGVLDPVPATNLPPAFRTEVLLLSPGQVTRPLPISGGVAIIKLVSIRQVPPAADRRRRPRGARGAAPAALRRAHHQLRPGLSPGTARRRHHRRAMSPARVALTLGDPAGIGGEIALKAWAALRDSLALLPDRRPRPHGRARRPPRRSGPPDRRARRGAGGHGRRPAGAAAPAAARRPSRAGRTRRTPRAVIDIIARGVELVRSGAALALCTNPIHKKALKDGAGFAFPGHTEFLAHLSGAPLPVMMLAVARAPRGAGDDPHPPRRACRRR